MKKIRPVSDTETSITFDSGATSTVLKKTGTSNEISSEDIDFSFLDNEENGDSSVALSEPKLEGFDFDTADFSNFGSDNYIWDISVESDWTLPLIEFNQYRATQYDAILNKLLDIPAESLERTKFKFENNWPFFSHPTPRPSKLFCAFHVFALKIILNPKHDRSIQGICMAKLIDLTRPVYDTTNNVYRSILSTAIEYQSIVEDAKFDILIAFTPKFVLDLSDSQGVLPLVAAINQNRLDLVRKLVNAGADMNRMAGLNVQTPVMRALEMSRFNIVHYFLSTGKFDPNIVLPDGTNVLVMFLKVMRFNNFHSKYFQNVFKGPIKLNVDTLKVALHQLYESKNSDYKNLISKVIVERLPLIQAINSLAYVMTCQNDLNSLKFLLRLRIRLDFLLPDGKMLIHVAIEHGHTQIIGLLHENGSNIDNVTFNGVSAIQMAYDRYNIVLVRDLIRLGVNSGLEDVIKRAISSDYKSIITALLERTPLNLTSMKFSNGYNPITWAIAENKFQILIAMIKSKKATLTVPDAAGRTIYNISPSDAMSKELKEFFSFAKRDRK